MRTRLIGVLVLLVVGAAVGAMVWKQKDSPGAQRERLVEDFIAILPDSLSPDHRLEIRQLFYMLHLRAEEGKVPPADLAALHEKVAGYVAAGRISGSDLVRVMAEVGYTTYKGEEKYNLPDGSVDHPILNPQSAMYPVRFDSSQYDSAFWADFEQWKRDNPEFSDSAFVQDSLPLR